MYGSKRPVHPICNIKFEVFLGISYFLGGRKKNKFIDRKVLQNKHFTDIRRQSMGPFVV
jgi:hypothetical protein